MKRFALVLLVILLLISCQKGLSKKDISKHKEAGLAYLEEGSFQKAIDSLLLIVDYDDDQAIKVALSDAYAGIKDYGNAIYWLEKIGGFAVQEYQDLINNYRVLGYLKDLATVDWEALKNKQWTYVMEFNDKYLKYQENDKYGLLDAHTYEVVLEAEYAEVFTIFGEPFNGKILVFKDRLDALSNNWEKAIILDGKLKESKEKVPIGGWGDPEPIGYFVDTLNDNLLMKAEYNKGGDYKVTVVDVIDKTRVVNGALRCDEEEEDEDVCYALYENEDKYFLTSGKDQKVYKLEGRPQDYVNGSVEGKSIVDNMIAMERNGKCGYYNSEGILISNFLYDLVYDTSEDRARCQVYNEGFVVVNSGGKFGLMNNKGVTVIEPVFDGMSPVFGDNFIFIYQDKIGVATIK